MLFDPHTSDLVLMFTNTRAEDLSDLEDIDLARRSRSLINVITFLY